MVVKINKGTALDNLSLTPLIDIVFLLLIFFLVATQFSEEEKEIDVLLPDASEAQAPTAKVDRLIINIDKDGRYFVTGKILTVEQLRFVLRKAYTDNPGRASAIIRGDRRCPHGFIIDAKNECLKAGIRDITDATQGSGG